MEKLDFRVAAERPRDAQLAYLAPAIDDRSFIEILGGDEPEAVEVRPCTTSPIVRLHSFCLNVVSVEETVAELVLNSSTRRATFMNTPQIVANGVPRQRDLLGAAIRIACSSH